MSNQVLADSIVSQVMIILDLNTQIQSVDERINSLNTDLDNAVKSKSQLMAAVKDAKKLLDYCVENNLDPIQCQLSHLGGRPAWRVSPAERILLTEDHVALNGGHVT
jgi:hypothetical protein